MIHVRVSVSRDSFIFVGVLAYPPMYLGGLRPLIAVNPSALHQCNILSQTKRNYRRKSCIFSVG